MEFPLEAVVQGGGIGIAAILIGYHFWKDALNAKKDQLMADTMEKFNDTMAKHLDKVDDTMHSMVQEMQRSNDNHIQALKVIENNTKAFARIEKALDTQARHGK